VERLPARAAAEGTVVTCVMQPSYGASFFHKNPAQWLKVAINSDRKQGFAALAPLIRKLPSLSRFEVS
jgi:hypothetical protein